MGAIRSFFGRLHDAIAATWSGVTAVVVSLGALGLLAVIAGAIMYLLLPELRVYVASLVSVGLLLVLIFVVAGFNLLKNALMGRRGRYGTNTSVMVVAFIAIAVVVNFLGARNFQRFDVTAAGQYSLAQQTIKVLQDLDVPVHATGFFTPSNSGGDTVSQLLKEYTLHTDKFTFDMVDPEANPSAARNYNVTQDGVVVFEAAGRRQQVTGQTEQDFTGGILRVTGKQQQKIYYLTGHDERNFADSGNDGYSLALKGLQSDNYDVQALSLSTTEKVPDDCSVLIIAGPKKPLLESEYKPIDDYLRNKGKVLFLLDPNSPDDQVKLLATWGLIFEKGTVVDTTSFVYPDKATPAIQRPQYQDSDITRNLDTTFFPSSAAITVNPENARQKTVTITASPVGITTMNSWIAGNYDPKNQDPKFNDATDRKGPVPLIVQDEATAPLGEQPVAGAPGLPEKKTRIVAIGNSAFASNQYFYSLGNSDLFLNSVNWLSGDESLISIRPKPPAFRRMVVTQQGWRWIVYSSIGLVPLIVIAAGGLNWYRRR